MGAKLKKLLLLLILLNSFLIGKVWATDYCTGAAGCYLFTEGSGTSVADSSSNANTGTFASSGHPAWATMAGTGAPTYAPYMVDLAGTTSDYISVNDDNTLDITNTLSICSWVNLDAAQAGVNAQLIAKDDDGTSKRSYGLLLFETMNSVSYVSMSIFKVGDSETRLDDTTDALDDYGTWHHVGGAYNYVSDGGSTIDLYLDGVKIKTMSTAKGPIQVTTSIVTLGMRIYSGAEAPFNGKMSESAIFNAYYTATEFDDIMDNGLAGAAPPAVTARPQVIFIGR